MIEGQKKIFNDLDTRAQMLDLRRSGYSYKAIAIKYGVDHTTIIYHCRRAGLLLDGIQPTVKVNKLKRGCGMIGASSDDLGSGVVSVINVEGQRPGWHKDEHGDWICLGRTTVELKQEEQSRKKRELDRQRIAMLSY